jgi:hypothetical protein
MESRAANLLAGPFAAMVDSARNARCRQGCSLYKNASQTVFGGDGRKWLRSL